ncbi:PREDICTED: centrosomal protein of 162 kDa [Dufourea novaeangliae]|uniref:Centrosomal protein of 162 kDa n=1 Tax=Dufourea novaeangliae TaxID=178035 RepID=A0A154P3V1_DUFNO|nr:PREDICTED: centrosomal protein of 162 kDa [Dufourea novaeangliae]KZC05810.1 Protein QN1 like protein [Dufourea novaeangliae]
MSSNAKKSPRLEDLISTEDDTLGSSISLSIGENSIRIKEKPKVNKELESTEKNEKEKWWLKKPETRLEVSNAIQVEVKVKQTPSPSPDISSSMKEFLEKEKMCKAMHKNEIEAKDKDDTLCDILASTAFDKYPSDFENATDEDIGSILEEMSKIAGALSPNSAPDRTKSRNSTKNQTEEEKSVEELLEEAEKLVRKNSSSLSKSGSKTDTLVPENIAEDMESLSRVRKLEADIFQMIEEEVHKETEKIKRSPKNEKKRESSPSIEVLYENVNTLRAPKTLELQRRKFEEQKVEVSSSSDLDDPIERHSKSEELSSTRKVESDKDNLQKEIIDVDKDFFEDLLKRSKERVEGGMSGSSSFGQEDFSHFLKLLQGQADKKEQNSNGGNHADPFPLKPEDKASVLERNLESDKSPEFPEKEISDILEKELSQMSEPKTEHEVLELDSSAADTERKPSQHASSSSKNEVKIPVKKDQQPPKQVATTVDIKKEELYAVGLTPRLELFADAIPKLLAEKSVESAKYQTAEAPTDPKTDVYKTTARSEIKTSVSAATTQRSSVERKSSQSASASSIKPPRKEIKFSKSKSYDQICKPPFRTSVENLRTTKPLDFSKKPASSLTRRSPILKPKLQPTIKPIAKAPPKTKVSPKPKKDPVKTGSTFSLSSMSRGYPMKSPDSYPKPTMAGGDNKFNLTKQNWELLCREERHKNALLKQQLESEVKMYKSQMDNMRVSFEEELFALKKQNIVLKARVDELSLSEKRPEPSQPRKDTRTVLLEKELEKQEKLIRGYETENKKLVQDAKRLQDEMRQLQKQKSTTFESGKLQELVDKVKDLEEEALKLNLEVSELREKNADCALKNEDLTEQNNLLNDELEMFKEQLRTKNDFITDRLQAMTTAELELKKKVEDLSVKLSSKTEQLRIVKQEFEKLQQNVLPLEKELLELRVKEGTLLEKLQVAKSHVEREKKLSQKLKDQVILDSKKITDLNRQVREMERILKRKNPDSVSALILTANSEQEKIGSEKLKLLEDRIASLECEIKEKDDLAQQKLVEFQKKFSDMKEKYSTQIMELEGKLLEASIKNHKVYNDMFTQTASRPVENKGVETIRKEERAGSFEKDDKRDQKPQVKISLKSQNPKEDTHLLATIRGLKFELTNKDKTVSKLTKEFQELQKTNRRLQKEREKLLNDRKAIKNIDCEKMNRGMVSSDSKLLSLRSTEGNDQNSNVYQNGHTPEINTQRLSASVQKLYDPMQYTENTDNNLVKRLTDENDILKEELNKMNKDFMALKNKRLHDLNLLQEEHEREMATLLKEYSVKVGDSKVVKLQSQINTQVAVISHLKQQIEKLRDYKEQVVVLKAEREHLENKVKALNERVKYLSTPSTEQLQLLQDKITILQQRHESREMTLQSLVRDLLRNRMQCKDCKNEKGKNRQLCYFRQELDHILGMLQEITNVH